MIAALRSVEADLFDRETRQDFSDDSYAAHVALIERAVQLDHDLSCIAEISMCRLRAALYLERGIAESEVALQHVLHVIPPHHPVYDTAVRMATRQHPELAARYAPTLLPGDD
ncbi:MAG: hypothetical protein Tsb0020_14980 [Haliangiales bacterium]